MRTTEESYIEYVCPCCSNKDNINIDLCEIRQKCDGTMYCSGYEKEGNITGYKRPLQKTAKLEHCVMSGLISDWSRL